MKHVYIPLFSLLLISSDALIAQERARAPDELPPEIQQGINQAIDESTAPLTQDEIRRTMKNFDQTQRATRNRYPNAKPVITTEVISNNPGAEIPVVYVGVGYNTNLVFKDAGGSPWPVQISTIGNADAYELIEIDKHIFQIQVKQPNAYSNLSFLLEGQQNLMVVNIHPPEKSIDVIKTYVVESGLSPASTQNITSMVNAKPRYSVDIDKDLNLFLDGMPPESAVSVPVMSGPNIDIWRYEDRLIIKTKMRITSPAARAEPLYGNNGWRVYSISNPNSTMAFIDNGQPKLVSISESAIAGMN